MSLDLNMKEIERKIYMVYHEDGLVDIAIGLVFLGWAAILAFGPPFLIVLLGPVTLLIYYFGKRDISVPRVGIIEPGRKIANRMRSLTMALIGLGLMALVTVLLQSQLGLGALEDYSLAFVGLIVAIGVCLLGFLLQADRLYVYAALLFVAFALGEALTNSAIAVDTFLLSVSIAGLIIFISGLLVLFRFIRRYPLPPEEV